MRRRHWIIAGVLLCLAALVFFFWRKDKSEQRFDRVIQASALHYGVDWRLVKSVVKQETRFRSNVRGGAGEIGLMQIRSAAAHEWAAAEKIKPFAHEHLFDPRTNTLAGTWYLRKLLRRYPATDNPLPYALADYNAGRNNVRRWARGEAATNSAVFIEKIGFPSTQKYVRSVTHYFEGYKVVYPDR